MAAQCKAVVTCNQGVRGGRVIDLKPTVDAAVKSCPSVRHVFVSQRTEKPAVMGKLDVPLEQVRHLIHTPGQWAIPDLLIHVGHY